MYPYRKAIHSKGAFCKGVLAPKAPEGGIKKVFP